MKSLDESLQRLLRAAARAPREEPGEMPIGLATRVLAQWRSAGAQPEVDWLGIWFRRGLVAAVAVMVLCIMESQLPGGAPAAGDPTSVNDVIQQAVAP